MPSFNFDKEKDKLPKNSRIIPENEKYAEIMILKDEKGHPLTYAVASETMSDTWFEHNTLYKARIMARKT